MSKQKYSISLNPKIIEYVDYYAFQNDVSRSYVINSILGDYFRENDVHENIKEEIQGQMLNDEVIA